MSIVHRLALVCVSNQIVRIHHLRTVLIEISERAVSFMYSGDIPLDVVEEIDTRVDLARNTAYAIRDDLSATGLTHSDEPVNFVADLIDKMREEILVCKPHRPLESPLSVLTHATAALNTLEIAARRFHDWSSWLNSDQDIPSLAERTLALLLNSHNAIEALKYYREVSGCGLKEAMLEVADLIRANVNHMPPETVTWAERHQRSVQ